MVVVVPISPIRWPATKEQKKTFGDFFFLCRFVLPLGPLKENERGRERGPILGLSSSLEGNLVWRMFISNVDENPGTSSRVRRVVNCV